MRIQKVLKMLVQKYPVQLQRLLSTVEPEVEDSDLDGLIQEIIKAVDNKAAEIEKELSAKEKPAKKSKSKK